MPTAWGRVRTAVVVRAPWVEIVEISFKVRVAVERRSVDDDLVRNGRCDAEREIEGAKEAEG
jgi:hypothetical protein